MEEWKEYRIGDIAKTNTSQYSLSENWETIQYLDTGSITKNQISGIEEFFGNTGLPSRARRKVKHGDIVYSCVRPNLCHYGYLDNPPANLLVSTGFAVITVDPNLADARYIYYFLTQNNIVQSLHTIGEQAVSTYPSIKASDIEDLSISLPSLPIQHKIADILKSLDDKIQVNRKINDNFYYAFFEIMLIWLVTSLENDNLEQQAQALFKSWFVDFDPFKKGEFIVTKMGKIPKGWKIGNLSEISHITMGASPSGTSYNVNGIGTVFYQGRAEFGFRFPHRNMFTTEPKRLAEEGDVLLSVRAPVGDVNVAYERCCIGRGLASIKSDRYPSYILYLLKSQKSVFEQYNGEGTVFGSINKNTLEGLPTIIPKSGCIERFESIVSSIDGQIRCREKESRRLTSLRDTLLPRLMSGTTKVHEINM